MADLGLDVLGTGEGAGGALGQLLAQRRAEQLLQQQGLERVAALQQAKDLAQQRMAESAQRDRELAASRDEARQQRLMTINLSRAQALQAGTQLGEQSYQQLTNPETGALFPEQFTKSPGTPASLPSMQLSGLQSLDQGAPSVTTTKAAPSESIPAKYTFGGTTQEQTAADKEARAREQMEANIANATEKLKNAQENLRLQGESVSSRIALQQAQAELTRANAEKAGKGDQSKFEQQYRTVLARGLSNRSGGLGLEDAKVQQANHLLSIFEQNYDPKTGQWNIPRVQLNELALGLARLTSPGGQAGEGLMHEFQQRTAKGDIAGALTYLTGQPVPANTQGLTQYLKESVERQGRTAEQNREGEMAYLRGLAPTELDEDRRKKLEATSLNPLRVSRLIQNKTTGERRLQVSVDGGATWK